MMDETGPSETEGENWTDGWPPHTWVPPVQLSICAQVGMSFLLGPLRSSTPRTPTTLTGVASQGRDPLASETPPGGTPWWPPLLPDPPADSPRPRARAAASGYPGSAPARPVPQLRSGGRRLRVRSFWGLSPDSASGAGWGGDRPRPPYTLRPLLF